MIFLSWVILGTNFLFYRSVFSEAFLCKPSIKTHWNLHKMAANLQLYSFRSLKTTSLTQTHRFFFILEELQALYMNSCVLLVYQCYLGSSQSLICNWNNSSSLIILSVMVFSWKHEVLRPPASQKIFLSYLAAVCPPSQPLAPCSATGKALPRRTHLCWQILIKNLGW